MAGNNDQIALGWVREEIAKSLEQARQGLEAFFENSDDETQLQICIKNLHQVKGTLQILDFPGAIALANEMEDLGLALESKETEVTEATLEALMGGILQLNLYLQKIQTGQQDMVFLLLPAINDLRQIRSLEPLSSESFVSKAVAIEPPKPSAKFELPDNPDAFIALSKKLRHHFQRGLLGVLKQENIDQSLQRIHKVLERLEALCHGHTVSHLWWIADGFVATLRENGLQDEKEAKVLLGHIDRQIKRLSEVGEEALHDDVSETLLHDLLEHISTSSVESTRISQIREAFAMDADETGTSDTAFAGASEDAMEAAAEVLKESIENVKVSIDLFVRNKQQDSSEAKNFLPQLKQVVDTLELLGLKGMRANLIQQMDILNAEIEKNDSVDDGVIMDIAGALLIIEASLSDLRNAQRNADVEQVEANAQESEFLQAQYQFIREARINLQRAQDSIVDFMASNGDQDAIREVPIWLADAEGGFNILSMQNIEKMIKSCRNYVEHKMLNQSKLPPQKELDALADVLTSVEYYLEGFSETGSQSLNTILTAADRSLSVLDKRATIVEEEIVEEAVTETKIDEAVEEDTQAPVEAQAVDQPDDDLVDDEIKEIFVEEAEDELASLGVTLPEWKVNPDNSEALATTRRSFHTLKGSGRLVGASAIGELAWSVESLLNKIIAQTHNADDAVFNIIAEVVDFMPQLVEAFKNGEAGSDAAIELAARVDALGVRTPIADDVELPQPVAEEEQLEVPELPSEDILEGFADDEPSVEKVATEEPIATDTIELESTEPEENLEEIQAETSVEESPAEEPLIEETVVEETVVEETVEVENLELEEKPELEFVDYQAIDESEQAIPHLAEEETSPSAEDIEEIAEEIEGLDFVINDESDTAAADVEQTFSADVDLTDTGLEDALKDIEEAAESLIAEEQLQQEQVESFSEEAIEVGSTADAVDVPTEESLEESENLEDEALDPVLVEIFTAEVGTHLETIDNFIEMVRDNNNEFLATDEIVRALHTIKGSAKMTHAKKIAEIAIPLEQHYRQLNSRIVSVSVEALEVLDSTSKYLHKHLDNLEQLEKLAEDDEYQSLLIRAKSLDALIPALVLEDEASDGDVIVNFLGDAQDQLDEITDIIDTWKFAPDNREAIHPIIIALTSISARAAELNFDPISVHANKVNDVLNKAFEEKYQLDEGFFSQLIKGVTFITEGLDRIAANQRPKIDQQLIQQLEDFEFTAAAVEELVEEPEVLEEKVEEEVSSEAMVDDDVEVDDEKASITEDDLSLTPGTEDDQVVAAEEATDDGFVEQSKPLELDKEDEEILEIFLEEARELIDEQEDTLHLWSEDLNNQEHLQLLLRQLHTLKGGARLSGVNNIADLSHELESLFESAVSGRIKADEPLLDLAVTGRTQLESMLNEITANSTLISSNRLIAELKAFARGESFTKEDAKRLAAEEKNTEVEEVIPENVVELDKKSSTKKSKKVKKAETKKPKKVITAKTDIKQDLVSKTTPKVREMIRVGSDTMEGLVNLAGETSIYRSRLEQQVTNFRFNLEEISSTVDRVRSQLRNLEIETEAQVEYRQERINEEQDEEFDPLEMDRYTRQQELTRGLGESTTDLLSLKDTLEGLAADAEVLLLQQSRVDSELQDRLMKTRLVPFSSITPRLRRMVRQISDELNKKVQLSIKAEGEMDRTVLERLIAPVEHMLRNAIDHGIETSSKRKKAKKPAEGRILIRLYREGPEVVIEIIDDGRGIDLAAVRNKAVERGLISPEADLADHELIMMILEAGFSTAAEVTQISGRGVGMDVVNNEIKQMGGNIDIDSVPGKGTTFTVKLPFTVSVNQALMVTSKEDLFAIPLTNIEGIVRVSPYELVEYYEMDRPEFIYADETYNLRYLGKILDVAEKPNLDGVTQPIPLLLLHGSEHPVALQVDDLLGSREIVVKSVGTQLSSISGIAGATILGDGSVVLILDLPAMLRRIDAAVSDGLMTSVYNEPEVTEKKPLVMVVDDSITVRKVTSRLLERNNFEVITAKDGVDAVTVLGERVPDIMLLDIEMPRMDGFELATIVRHDDRLKKLPIIMITSRTGDKHKTRATEIGVDEFMGKPFNEVDLLNMIEDLLAR